MNFKKIIALILMFLCVVSTFLCVSAKKIDLNLENVDLNGVKNIFAVVANYKEDVLYNATFKMFDASEFLNLKDGIKIDEETQKSKLFLYTDKGETLLILSYEECVKKEEAEINKMPSLFLIGDSICTYYEGDKHYPQQGWGAKIGDFFENINVVNCARPGYSTATYLVYDRYTKSLKYGPGFAWDNDKVFVDEEGNTRDVTPVLPQIKEGDFVLVSLGINDGYDINRQKDEFGQTTAETYKKHLQKFIDDTRNKGAKIIFATPTTNGRKTDNEYKENYVGRASLMKEVADKNNVPCLELGKEMATRYNLMGDEDVKKMHMVYSNVKDQLKVAESEHNNSNVKQQKDDTVHLTEKGATFVADVICDLLKDTNSKLKEFLKD